MEQFAEIAAHRVAFMFPAAQAAVMLEFLFIAVVEIDGGDGPAGFTDCGIFYNV